MNISELLKKEAFQSQKRTKIHSDRGKYSRPIYAYEHHLGISMKKVLNRIKKRQDHSIIVLDVMCESGSTVRELNKDYAVNAFGVDILHYPEYENLGYKNRFIITPAEDLSMIPDESIDLILNLNGYTEFSSSLYKSIKEALRVLCPGGELHSVPFRSREESTDSYCRDGYKALDDYENETGQILKHEATRRLSWHRFPPVRMSPVLHLEKSN